MFKWEGEKDVPAMEMGGKKDASQKPLIPRKHSRKVEIESSVYFTVLLKKQSGPFIGG